MTKPGSSSSYYPAAPFHAVRVCAAICSVIVTSILISFCYHLKNDGFKIPWTFLFVLAASIFSLLSLLITSIIQCCGRISPLLNVLINIPLFMLWLVAFSLLCRNILGVLAHSCSLSVWAADDGVSVCRSYKLLFSFVVFGLLFQLAQVVLDVKARRQQVRDGKYDKMNSSSDIKMEPTTNSSGLSNSTGLDKTYSPSQPDWGHDSQGWRPGTSDVDHKKHSVTTATEVYPVHDTTQQHRQVQGFHHGQPELTNPYEEPAHYRPHYSNDHYSTPDSADRSYAPSQYSESQYRSFSHPRQTGGYDHPPPQNHWNPQGYSHHNDRY